jgi:hypothetical protein
MTPKKSQSDPSSSGAGIAGWADALCSLASAAPSPPRLPLVHVTTYKGFLGILASDEIQAKECAAFCEALSYFSYGAPYYRTSRQETERFLDYPVALAFDQALIDLADWVAPMDTGAIHHAIYPSEWCSKLGALPEVRTALNGRPIPQKLVQHYFLGNDQYLQASLRTHNDEMPEHGGAVLALLGEFLSLDLSQHGIDASQRMIEVQRNQPTDIWQFLMWVSCPNSLIDSNDRGLLPNEASRKMTEHQVQLNFYQARSRANPAALVEVIFHQWMEFLASRGADQSPIA